MEPGQLLFTLLAQDAAVAALLGYVQAGEQHYRIYPLRVPAGVPLPYLTYQVINQQPEAGSSATCQLDDEARVQVSLFAATYAQVCALSAAVRAALGGQQVGRVSISLDTCIDQYSDPAACFFRTQDYLLDGLAS